LERRTLWLLQAGHFLLIMYLLSAALRWARCSSLLVVLTGFALVMLINLLQDPHRLLKKVLGVASTPKPARHEFACGASSPCGFSGNDRKASNPPSEIPGLAILRLVRP
jgi:hypothetical protein